MQGMTGSSVLFLEKELCYRLLESREETWVEYGLAVEYGEECSYALRLTSDRQAVERLAAGMLRGRVTPATFMDVVEDWLVR